LNGGKNPKQAIKLEKIFNQDDIFLIIEKVINFYKKNEQPKQRLEEAIECFGKENFLKVIGQV